MPVTALFAERGYIDLIFHVTTSRAVSTASDSDPLFTWQANGATFFLPAAIRAAQASENYSAIEHLLQSSEWYV